MNLLTDPLITVRATSGDTRTSLPKLLDLLLSSEQVQGFPRLGAEQRSYWWRLLVRCGARALRTAGLEVETLVNDRDVGLEETLRSALLQHTAESDWALYQAAPHLAGFLQPPTPGEGAPADEKYKRNSAALLTAVIGTKEHERKSEVGRELDAESLIYTLVEYQGGVIFGGRGNYESQFMGSRSGAGSGTPFMGAWIDRSDGRTFRHDVCTLLDRWDENGTVLQGDIWALWTRPWDGVTPTPATRLDPAFIPLARLVRIGQPSEGRFGTVWFRASKASRISDPTEGGNLGDPFTPLVPDPKGGHLKVRGTLSKGYDYKEVVRLLLSQTDAVPSPSVQAALEQLPAGDDLRVIFEGTAFEQGKTRGFHRRVVRLPAKALRSGLLGFSSEPLHAAHESMLASTANAKRTLRAALAIFLTGAPLARDEDRSKMAGAMDRVEEIVDRRYLSFLFGAAEASQDTDATLPYRQWLFEMVTKEIFPESIASLPRRQGRRWDEEVSAEAYLRGRLRRELNIPQPEASKETVA